MKEDIEMLKEFAHDLLQDYIYSPDEVPECDKKLSKAIENLIARNKELKEHIQKFYNAELFTAKQAKLIEKNYIPKSKVREIIYPTPENPIPIEIQTSNMYKKLKKISRRR